MTTIKLLSLFTCLLIATTPSCKEKIVSPEKANEEYNPEYIIDGMNNSLWTIYKDGKYDFIDIEGNVYDLNYAYALDFKYGLAAVGKETVAESYPKNKYGYINANLAEVIDLKYTYAYSFAKNGLAEVRTEIKGRKSAEYNSYINKKGEQISEYYAYTTRFKENLAFVKNEWDQPLKCISYSDNKIIEKFTLDKKYEIPEGFNNELCTILNTEDNTFGCINKTGELVIPCKYKQAGVFNEGLMMASIGGNDYGYVNKTGDFVIDEQYKYASEFVNGLAPVSEDGSKWIFIDKNGDQAIEGNFSGALWFNEGLAPVMKDGAWGYIDINGSYLIEPQYESVGCFFNGIAKVEFNNATSSACINTKGEKIWESDNNSNTSVKSTSNYKNKTRYTLNELLNR